jgi:hypothetical protein
MEQHIVTAIVTAQVLWVGWVESKQLEITIEESFDSRSCDIVVIVFEIHVDKLLSPQIQKGEGVFVWKR